MLLWIGKMDAGNRVMPLFVYLLFFVAELGDVTYLHLTINNIGAAAIAN